MNIVFFVLIIITLWKARLRKGDEIGAFLEPKYTGAINGIFAVLVFMRHFYGRFNDIYAGSSGRIYGLVNSVIGQRVVSTFLFFSGFGIMYSVMLRDGYVSSIPKRFLKLLLRFDIVVLICWGTFSLMGNHFGTKKVLLSLLTIESVGNYNWYIMAILCMYLVSYIAAKLSHVGVGSNKKTYLTFIGYVFIGCLVWTALTYLAGKEARYYETILCYPVGMLLALFSDVVKRTVTCHNNGIRRYVAMAVCFVLFWLFRLISANAGSHFLKIGFYEVASVTFVLTILSFASIVKIWNPILDFLGKRVFEIYMMQKIPMVILEKYFVGKVPIMSNKYVLFVVCFGATLILAEVFKVLADKLMVVLFERKQERAV